jgi:creatine kinase
VGAKFDVSNKQRLGFSEVQLVQKMIDGVTKVLELEEMLGRGATPDDIRVKIGVATSVPRDPYLVYGGAYLGDVKDAADLKYVTYTSFPALTDKHKSLMAKTLTPALFEKLKNARTSKGYTLSNAIQAGVVTPHLGTGCTAGDEESWELFKELYYPIIKKYHGYDAYTQKHPVDLDPSLYGQCSPRPFACKDVWQRLSQSLKCWSIPCPAICPRGLIYPKPCCCSAILNGAGANIATVTA